MERRARVRLVTDRGRAPGPRPPGEVNGDGRREGADLLRELLVNAHEFDAASWGEATEQLAVQLKLLNGCQLRQSEMESTTTTAAGSAFGPPLAAVAAVPAARAVPGTIQSAKGERHAATLILECLGKTGRKFDVSEALRMIAEGNDPLRELKSVQAARAARLRRRDTPHSLAGARRPPRPQQKVRGRDDRRWLGHPGPHRALTASAPPTPPRRAEIVSAAPRPVRDVRGCSVNSCECPPADSRVGGWTSGLRLITGGPAYGDGYPEEERVIHDDDGERLAAGRDPPSLFACVHSMLVEAARRYRAR